MSRKTANQNDIYSRLTNQIIADLEKGVKSWTKPWKGGDDQSRITTETGYRSHFHHEEALAEYSDAKAYVLAWLEHEAKTTKWNAYVESRQQLSLL